MTLAAELCFSKPADAYTPEPHFSTVMMTLMVTQMTEIFVIAYGYKCMAVVCMIWQLC